KNRLAELERLSRFVDQFGERNGVGAEDLFAIKLALDEVVTNVIRYGHEDAGEHEIVIRIAREGGDLAVEVDDDGRPFDPLGVAEPDVDKPLEERPLGGLGIHLARKMTDRLQYRREGNRNVLTMRRSSGQDRQAPPERRTGVEILETRENAVVILGLTGRIDAANAGLLEENVLRLIDAGERRLVFDLAGVDYISSAGLRVFLVAAKRLRSADGMLALAGLQDRVCEVFEMAGLSSVLRVCRTRAEAVAAV